MRVALALALSACAWFTGAASAEIDPTKVKGYDTKQICLEGKTCETIKKNEDGYRSNMEKGQGLHVLAGGTSMMSFNLPGRGDVCVNITNNCSNDLFVPTQSTDEYDSFRTDHPSCASVANCGYHEVYTGWGSCNASRSDGCGSGTQSTAVECYRDDGLAVDAQTFCGRQTATQNCCNECELAQQVGTNLLGGAIWGTYKICEGTIIPHPPTPCPAGYTGTSPSCTPIDPSVVTLNSPLCGPKPRDGIGQCETLNEGANGLNDNMIYACVRAGYPYGYGGWGWRNLNCDTCFFYSGRYDGDRYGGEKTNKANWTEYLSDHGCDNCGHLAEVYCGTASPDQINASCAAEVMPVSAPHLVPIVLASNATPEQKASLTPCMEDQICTGGSDGDPYSCASNGYKQIDPSAYGGWQGYAYCSTMPDVALVPSGRWGDYAKIYVEGKPNLEAVVRCRPQGWTPDYGYSDGQGNLMFWDTTPQLPSGGSGN